jgi:hypothetical protein
MGTRATNQNYFHDNTREGIDPFPEMYSLFLRIPDNG